MGMMPQTIDLIEYMLFTLESKVYLDWDFDVSCFNWKCGSCGQRGIIHSAIQHDNTCMIVRCKQAIEQLKAERPMQLYFWTLGTYWNVTVMAPDVETARALVRQDHETVQWFWSGERFEEDLAKEPAICAAGVSVVYSE